MSGSGKSTLINLVAGLTKPDHGNIQLNNRILTDTTKQIHLPPNHRNVGYVFQDARLFPHYTVKGNLCYGMKNTNQQQFDHIVQLLGIEHLLKRYPITLSGGEKQRVSIGRALLTQPEILLMDEPLSALDIPRKQELLNYLDKLAENINIPILYVTHSIEELLHLADQVVLMDNGKVKAYGHLENLWQTPLFDLWKSNNRQSTVLSLPIQHHNKCYKMTALALGEQSIWITEIKKNIGEYTRVCIYATDVSITLTSPEKTSIRNILFGKITALCEKENHVNVQIKVEHNLIWASISKWSYHQLALQIEQNVYVQIKSVSLIK